MNKKANERKPGNARRVWESHFGKIPKGIVIHHRDLNPGNDDISNLQMMTKTKHDELHADLQRQHWENLIKRTVERENALRAVYDRYTIYKDTGHGYKMVDLPLPQSAQAEIASIEIEYADTYLGV